MATEADAIPQAERFEVDIDPALVIAAYPRHRRRHGMAPKPADERNT